MLMIDCMANWLVENGAQVERDQEIAEVESDKATLPLIAVESGKIEIFIEAGDEAKVGDVACKIDTEQKGTVKEPEPLKTVGKPEVFVEKDEKSVILS